MCLVKFLNINTLAPPAIMMEAKGKKMLRFFVALLFAIPLPLSADVWVDEDGVSAVEIEGERLTIYSLDNFYYFDELFTHVRRRDTLRLCVGFGGEVGTASDCLGDFVAIPAFYNGGKNRALHFNISGLSFVFFSFEEYLRAGRAMKLSIDNGDLFSAYNLHIDFKFTEDALEILAIDN